MHSTLAITAAAATAVFLLHFCRACIAYRAYLNDRATSSVYPFFQFSLSCPAPPGLPSPFPRVCHPPYPFGLISFSTTTYGFEAGRECFTWMDDGITLRHYLFYVTFDGHHVIIQFRLNIRLPTPWRCYHFYATEPSLRCPSLSDEVT